MSDLLSPEKARLTLPLVGRVLYDANPRSMWDRDTATLPRVFRRLRFRYREFAQTFLAPHALEMDLDPHSFDHHSLFRESAARGFQTEFMPWPWGTFSLVAGAHSLLLASMLKGEEFCAGCGGLGLSLLAHDLGIAPLFVSGDLGQYFKWLGRIYREIRAGEPAVAAFAITEPGAGSDVEETEGAKTASIQCFYRDAPGGFILNGRKVFISGGASARWATFFAARKGCGVDTWTCFLIDKSMKGFTVGRREKKMGQRASDASELILEDVFVPADRVIGKVAGGWAINRNVLNYSRPVVGAIALGIARGAFEHAARFCSETKLGKRRLMDRQDVQIRLSDMLMELSAMRGMLWQSARYRIPFQGAGAAAKVFCSDHAWEVCNQALELIGDYGTVHSNSVEKCLRDARLTQIYEGANQIGRLAIFESQALAEFA